MNKSERMLEHYTIPMTIRYWTTGEPVVSHLGDTLIDAEAGLGPVEHSLDLLQLTTAT